MVPQCCMLSLHVYGLQQYGQLNDSCPLSFLFCSVLQFKIENRYLEWLSTYNLSSPLFA